MKTVKVMKLYEDAKLPTRKHSTDAGMDFYAYDNVYIEPHDVKILRTGVTVEVPDGYMLLLKPKGRNDYLVGSGVVDTGYEPGEILVKIINPFPVPIAIKKGDAIAQGVFVKISTPEIVEVEDITPKSARAGKGGIVTQLSKAELTDPDNF